jgi:hypothetical protein
MATRNANEQTAAAALSLAPIQMVRGSISGATGPTVCCPPAVVDATGGGGGGSSPGAADADKGACGAGFILGGAPNGAASSGAYEENFDLFQSLGAMHTFGSAMQTFGSVGAKPASSARNYGSPSKKAEQSFGASFFGSFRAASRGGKSARADAKESATRAAVQLGALPARRGSAAGRAIADSSKEVPWHELTLLDRLGHGAFGEVFAVDYAFTKCAVKRLHAAEGSGVATLAEHLKAEVPREGPKVA